MRSITGMFLYALVTHLAASEPVWLGKFSGDAAMGAVEWQNVWLNDKIPSTSYRPRYWDGMQAIEASAVASMSLFTRTVAVDLKKTPVLCWHWRINSALEKADMKRKSGDDYAARVYVGFTLPTHSISLIERTKLKLARRLYGRQVPDSVLNYVWDNRYPVGTRQPNVYTARTQMIVLQSGNANQKKWLQERRNLTDDFSTAFSSPAGRLSMLALATDTDNTGESARAGFANVHLVAIDQPCQGA
jgi:hypothetical protein